MSDAVLDASAVLAFLQAESGADDAAEAMATACMSAVNVCEVVAKLVEHGLTDDEAEEAVTLLPFDVVPFDGSAALSAGRLHRRTRGRNVSLGDRACLDLAMTRALPALTTDRAWLDLGLPVEIRPLR